MPVASVLPLPGSPALCPLCLAKTIPHRLQQSSFSPALQPACLSIKVSSKCFFFFLFTLTSYVYCMWCWNQLAWNLQSSCRGLVNIGTDASARGVKAPRQPGETFYCDVKTHPSGPARCYERAYTLYRVCSLNFHRLSRFRSHPVATGCISKATCNLWYVILEVWWRV